MTKFYVDNKGNYIGGFDGAEPPQGAIEVPVPPANANLKWIDGDWKESADDVIVRLEKALDVYIDEQAKSFRYESIRTMVTYVGDPNSQFHSEGVGAKEFRSQCYTLALMIINEVKQGRPIPSEEELLSEMPKLADFVKY